MSVGRFFSSSEEQVNLLNFSSISTNSSLKKSGKIERVGGCGYHGICFTTRAKGGVEQDVLEKSKEPIEIDVENGNLHVLNMFLVASQMHVKLTNLYYGINLTVLFFFLEIEAFH